MKLQQFMDFLLSLGYSRDDALLLLRKILGTAVLATALPLSISMLTNKKVYTDNLLEDKTK